MRELGKWTPKVKVEVFPGSYHGFDHPSTRVRVRTDVPNGVKRGEGVTVGSNPQARQGRLRDAARISGTRIAVAVVPSPRQECKTQIRLLPCPAQSKNGAAMQTEELLSKLDQIEEHAKHTLAGLPAASDERTPADDHRAGETKSAGWSPRKFSAAPIREATVRMNEG